MKEKKYAKNILKKMNIQYKDLKSLDVLPREQMHNTDFNTECSDTE